MQRSDLLHVLRAADSIVDGRARFVVVGSQAILGTVQHYRDILIRSMEADLAVDVPEQDEAERLAMLISGSIGEGSMFEATWGYHADGVELGTAVLAPGWRERVIPVQFQGAHGPTDALCLSARDLAVSKLMAGREKDFEFVAVMIDERLVDPQDVAGLLRTLPPSEQRAKADAWLQSPPRPGLAP